MFIGRFCLHFILLSIWFMLIHNVAAVLKLTLSIGHRDVVLWAYYTHVDEIKRRLFHQHKNGENIIRQKIVFVE